uniref:RNase H type-1 domain-containing protein n=1 Tax=Chenopodium quinoa TaxID=63459 RepID=A0A803MQV0_CHEQI
MDSAASSSSSASRIWAPPHRGYFKLNTDGSWMNLENAGGGGVIRCQKGLWQDGFAVNFNVASATSAKLLAIREGLLIAWKRKIEILELETDADALSKMLKNPEAFLDNDLGNIIRDVAALLNRNWKVTIFFMQEELATLLLTN